MVKWLDFSNKLKLAYAPHPLEKSDDVHKNFYRIYFT